jgi:hypothetical protein
VTKDQWQLRIWQFAVEHMEIGSTDRAGGDTHE